MRPPKQLCGGSSGISVSLRTLIADLAACPNIRDRVPDNAPTFDISDAIDQPLHARPCRSISVHRGPCRSAHFGSFWPSSVHSGPFPEHFGPFRSVSAHLGPFRPIWVLVGPFRCILAGPVRSISVQFCPGRSMHFGPLRFISVHLAHLGLFGSISAHVGRCISAYVCPFRPAGP